MMRSSVFSTFVETKLIIAFRYGRIFGGTCFVSLLSSAGWVYERIERNAAIDFMQHDWVFINCGSDPELSFILVAITTCTSTAIGGTLGATVRYESVKQIV
jgi:hypothetical protein